MPWPTDRRSFLSTSSALLLAGAVARTRESDAQEPGDSTPVRIAVVGTGGRGCDLIRKLATIEGAQIVAVCDDYPPHLENGQKYAGAGAAAYADYEKMLRETKPQAVVVAVPLHLHYAMCEAALDAGAAVFCEKTMCKTAEEARRLALKVEKLGAVFQVGLQRRANAIYAQAEAMAETGMLGRISAIKCQWNRNNDWRRPVPVGPNDPRFAELERRLNWRLYWEKSEGLMAELASHQLDVTNRLLGTTPKRVIATGGIDWWNDGREVYDNLFCVYEYEVDASRFRSAARRRETPVSVADADALEHPDPYTVRVTYSSLQNNAYEGASELVMGTKGSLFLTQSKGLFYQEAIVEDPGWSQDGRVKADAGVVTSGKTLTMANDPWSHRGKPYEIDATGDDTRDELLSFVEHVAAGDPATICDVRIGLANTLTILAGNEAIREGRAVEIPSA
jgi:predicted dehydrogenase